MLMKKSCSCYPKRCLLTWPRNYSKPMVGVQIRADAASTASWNAGRKFTAFWLPYCSGLRSEGIIVLGSLLTWWAAENAIATRRLLPAALAAIAASFTLALAPHGVIGVAETPRIRYADYDWTLDLDDEAR